MIAAGAGCWGNCSNRRQTSDFRRQRHHSPPMHRFPAFDPPEYVDWKADPALARRFRETIEHTPERAALVARLSTDDRLALYAGLLRARLHDIQLKRWVRTGIISKAWLGTGEEATTVGPVHALERGTDIVAPMIRNAA